MGSNVLGAEDPDGVFPGNDADYDGIADNNKNNNNLPDYSEPFLMYDVDPDEFVFGNDYNNNTIPDFREDDVKMDLRMISTVRAPCFISNILRFQASTCMSVLYDPEGVGLDNRTNDDYFKLQMNYDVVRCGQTCTPNTVGVH